MNQINKLAVVLLFALTSFIVMSAVAKNSHPPSTLYPDRIAHHSGSEPFVHDLVYGVATDWLGHADTLRFNIAFPPSTLKRAKNPFVLLMHGGGFLPEEQSKDKGALDSLCKLLAKNGIVAATIDYRVGWKVKDQTADPMAQAGASTFSAAYRAYQDAHAALRYFVHYADQYGIDTNAIFIGGKSAGANVALNTAFSSQKDIDAIMSDWHLNCHKQLGALDSSTNDLSDPYKIKGVIDMWGFIDDTSFIDPAEARNISLLTFHSLNDRVTPCQKFSPPQYYCTCFGSQCLAARFKDLHGYCELQTRQGASHGKSFSDEFLAKTITAFIDKVWQHKEITTPELTKDPDKGYH